MVNQRAVRRFGLLVSLGMIGLIVASIAYRIAYFTGPQGNP